MKINIDVTANSARLVVECNNTKYVDIWDRTDFGAQQRSCGAVRRYNKWLDALAENSEEAADALEGIDLSGIMDAVRDAEEAFE